ncbi:TolC family protein [candidate division KSB1 bacterium]|nr:TolC family protein [candidate division KSB1 bacterium]
MKRIPFALATLVWCSHLVATDLSLFDCYEKAEKAHPLQEEWRNRQHIYELQRANLNAKWLPSLNATANATYMSDVVDFGQVLALPFAMPSTPFSTMPKEQYKFTLDLQQTIYDGGTVSAGKKVELAVLDADLQALQTEFYQVREQVNQVYFALLMLEKQAELATIFKKEILQRLAAVQSAVRNGAVLPSNLDILEAELLSVDQQITELMIRREEATTILSQLVGEETDESTFILPTVQIPSQCEIHRPEMELFEKRKMALEMDKKKVRSTRLPKAALFGTYGYGQPPGSDFFNDHFDTYYIVGAAINWEIFNWNSSRRSSNALQAQQNIIDAKKAHFAQKIEIALQNSRSEIDRINASLESDEKLLALRIKIVDAAAAKLDNGAISATEFTSELNAVHRARINSELHKIQLVQAIVNYLTISGQWAD